MFGIGKKKEAAKVSKEGQKEIENEIQFDFDEDDKLPFDDDDGFADDGFTDEDMEEEPPRNGLRQLLSQRNLLLILLLLLALGAGGYYYLNGTPEPQPATPVKAKITVQPAAPKAVEVKPETPVAVVPAPAPQAAPAPVPVPVPVPEKTAPAPAATVAKGPESSPATPTPSEVKSEVVTAPATRQPFTLSAGAFLSKENQQEIEKKIRRLGYTPKVQTTSGRVTMTRLLLGIYDDPAAAQSRSRELSTLIPNLFSLQEGDKVSLYAGSYQSVEQARQYAGKLYQQGILADEETVSVHLPLKKISFGSFATRTEAEKAAKRAMDVGLTAQVVKR